ncbi:MAG: glycosyltransferase family 2 protein [Legionellales bacterium]|nr:glycosyltransferase family 2 protein [Legionellales bacterium]
MLSVMIIAKNEAATIRRCLEALGWADEIIVLDSGSEDATVAIAREYTPHVFQTDWQGFGVQKQRALEKASGDWILNLDADEVITEALRDEILAAISRDQMSGFRVPIRMYFYGKALRFSAGPQRHVRLFKRLGARFSNDLVHEKILLPENSQLGRLKNPILHHSFRDVSHALAKMNLYSSYSARIRIDAKKRHTLTQTVLSSLWMFFRCYILQRGFLDGKPGLVLALFQAQGSWYRGIKQLYRDA